MSPTASALARVQQVDSEAGETYPLARDHISGQAVCTSPNTSGNPGGRFKLPAIARLPFGDSPEPARVLPPGSPLHDDSLNCGGVAWLVSLEPPHNTQKMQIVVSASSSRAGPQAASYAARVRTPSAFRSQRSKPAVARAIVGREASHRDQLVLVVGHFTSEAESSCFCGGTQKSSRPCPLSDLRRRHGYPESATRHRLSALASRIRGDDIDCRRTSFPVVFDLEFAVSRSNRHLGLEPELRPDDPGERIRAPLVHRASPHPSPIRTGNRFAARPLAFD